MALRATILVRGCTSSKSLLMGCLRDVESLVREEKQPCGWATVGTRVQHLLFRFSACMHVQLQDPCYYVGAGTGNELRLSL